MSLTDDGVASARCSDSSEECPKKGGGRRALFSTSGHEGERSRAKVFLRMKPVESGATVSEYRVEPDGRTVVFLQPKTARVRLEKLFSFTHVFEGDATQEEVFSRTSSDGLAAFVQGRDCTVLAYGASGSGKTYSLMGTENDPGVVPRCVESLFKAIRPERLPNFKPDDGHAYERLNSGQRRDQIREVKLLTKENVLGETPPRPTPSPRSVGRDKIKYEVWASFTEIYNEAIYDLLRPEGSTRGQPPPRLRLARSADGRPFIMGAKWIYVRNNLEAYALLEAGRRRLRYAHTNMNSHSSRSHCLFSLKLLRYQDPDRSDVYISNFRLYDLAGSERVKRTGNEGARLDESKSINTSLHVLERCLASLRDQQEGQTTLPPYRESKLTTLLQNALSGNEAISMLVTISPEAACYSETQHTLQFSAIAKHIVTHIEKTDCFRRSRSCVDISDFSINNSSFSYNEVVILKEEIKRLQEDYESKLEQKEREVRREMYTKFSEIKNRGDMHFEDILAKERKLLNDLHEMRIQRLKENLYLEHSEEIQSLTKENNQLKEKLKLYEEKYGEYKEQSIHDESANINTTKENANSSENSSKGDLSFKSIDNDDVIISNNDEIELPRKIEVKNKLKLQLKKRPASAENNQDENVTTFVSTINIDENNDISKVEILMNGVKLDDRNENDSKSNTPTVDTVTIEENSDIKKESPNVLPPTPTKDKIDEVDKENEAPNPLFFTEKKGQVNALLSIHGSVIGSSRRKLFTKRENNELAAEIREPPKSQKHLNFEEDSPGQLQPPKMEKPYKYEKQVRSTRRNKKNT